MNEPLSNMLLHLRFLSELLLGILPFFLPLAKRKHLWLRLILSLCCLCAMSLISLPFGAELFFYFLGAAGMVWLCCAVTPQDALYCVACGYAWQHFCYALREAVRLAAGIPDTVVMAPGWSAVSIAVILVSTVPAYFLFARQMAEKKQYNMDTHYSLASTITVLIIVWIFSIAASTAFEAGMERLYIVCNLYDMFCCFFLLWIQVSQIRRSRLERQLTFQQVLRNRQREQYELTRENIDLINRKCHDLKHQMAALRTIVPEAQRKAYLDEVERSIQIYDSTLETGNEVLDTILTEKSLYCDAHHINMTCVADGRGLAFMDSMDIYAIFGNALDNAIRAVLRLDDPQKRVIAVSVWTKNGLALFQFENYFEGELSFDDGLPRTTKGSEDYHGYGMKSIRETAKKYGGQMTLHTENNLFLLRVSVPVPM